MMAMAGPRKTVSIHDYPEHLNPFREEDNHSKIRFWTIGRKLSRSNSITFSGLKDLRNSWSLRSFMKKGKKNEHSSQNSKYPHQSNGDHSPIVFRRAMQYSSMSRSTVGSPERIDRYVYGGSVTPLPRSRFQERLRSSQQEVNSPSATPRMARSDITGSRLSVESTNPFDEAPIPPVRASRRKKKRAPAPPATSAAEESSVTSENLELSITEPNNNSIPKATIDDEMEDMNLKVELKIIEDDDDKAKEANQETKELSNEGVETTHTICMESDQTTEDKEISEDSKSQEEIVDLKNNSEEEVIPRISFPKVDISKYRRNSSVNEDDVRLRRGNLEDFQTLTNKRSKSLSNNLSDESYIAYDINLNENKTFDINCNEEPQKVVCKLIDESKKKSLDNSFSSTEKEFLEIDKATRELEREISKLNSALKEDDFQCDTSRLSVSEIRQRFDRTDNTSPNPIPKPRRSNCGESSSINGKL